MNMRFRNVRDLETFFSRGLDVLFGVPVRVDYNRLARGLAAYDVARLGELVVV